MSSLWLGCWEVLVCVQLEPAPGENSSGPSGPRGPAGRRSGWEEWGTCAAPGVGSWKIPRGWTAGRPGSWVPFPVMVWGATEGVREGSGQRGATLSEGIWGCREPEGAEGESLLACVVWGVPSTQCFVL